MAGITAWHRHLDTKYGRERLHTLDANYVDAILEAEMTPVIVPNRLPEEAAREVVRAVDALVISGGDDVDPGSYGRDRASVEDEDIAVDRFEVAVLDEARRTGVPVLAICRGIQILNVALGGTLSQEVTTPGGVHEPVKGDPEEVKARRHEVSLEPTSVVGAIFGSTSLSVNTLHHQGIENLATDLVAEGVAADGLIEAVRYQGDWWAVGVQWHPEAMGTRHRRPLFQALSDQVRR